MSSSTSTAIAVAAIRWPALLTAGYLLWWYAMQLFREWRGYWLSRLYADRESRRLQRQLRRLQQRQQQQADNPSSNSSSSCTINQDIATVDDEDDDDNDDGGAVWASNFQADLRYRSPHRAWGNSREQLPAFIASYWLYVLLVDGGGAAATAAGGVYIANRLLYCWLFPLPRVAVVAIPGYIIIHYLLIHLLVVIFQSL